MPDYSHIKEKYRQPTGTETFGDIKFHRAPLVKVRLSWPQRFGALAELLNPRRGFWALLHHSRAHIAEFRTGWRYEIGVK